MLNTVCCSQINFIEENGLMGIKNESRHITLKFSNVCTKVDSKFQKILKYYKYGIPHPTGELIFE